MKKNTIVTLADMKARGEKISQLTCYDYSTARLMDQAGINMILVGDSLGMTMQGYSDTIPVTMEEMIVYGRSVVRGCENTFVVVDMPFMSYQASVEQAVVNAGRLMKETGCDAVKLEGGREVCDQIRAITAAGIPVCAHVGMTPQSHHAFGGFKVQGKGEEGAARVLADAMAVQAAGAFAVVLECVPPKLAALTIRVISTILIALPVFWVATLVLIYPNLWWGWAPKVTYVPIWEHPLENLAMFLPPAILSAIGQAGIQMRTIRTMTLEVMRQDYIRTAWAKGVPERRVLFKYAFRNSMIPIITMIGGSVAMMIGGNVVMENIFNIPGLGQAMVAALNSRDYPIVQGCVLVLSLFVMCINLLVDLAYKWIDPRVSLE